MLVDFRAVKDALYGVMETLDHSDLNENDAFQDLNPTSENIAQLVYRLLCRQLNCEDYRVSRVAVGESPGASVSYQED